MPRHEDGVPVTLWKHAAGIKPHTERGRMRTHQSDRRREFAAGMSPAVFGLRNISLITVRCSEILTHFGDAIKLILRNIFRHPVAPLVGEVELLGFRMPAVTDPVANAKYHHFGPSASVIDPPDLS